MRRVLLTTIVAGIFLSLLSYGYSGGDGTADNPYRISFVADWQKLMSTHADWDKSFILTNDLKFSRYSNNADRQFQRLF